MSPQTIDIQIPNIEIELAHLRGLPQKDNANRACLFTLIIYAHEPRRVKYLEELVDSILDKFPCRIIFIQGDKESVSSYFRVTVSNVMSRRSKASTAASFSCDQILIEASYDQLFRTPFIVTPHIVPDLPVYLLWGQNPFEERDIFPYLQPHARRVIFDSECADDLRLFCKEMQVNLDMLKMEIMDINWALVSNWRDLLGEIFDAPEKIEHLKACKSIIINYNSYKTPTTEHPETRALYLQGWLASALHWKYQGIERFESNTVLSYFGAVHPVVIGLSPQEIPTLPPGAISSIEIKTSTHQTYLISRKDNLEQVTVHISSTDTCELPFTLYLPNIHKGLFFMKEIFFSGLGDHYRETLKAISKIDFKP